MFVGVFAGVFTGVFVGVFLGVFASVFKGVFKGVFAGVLARTKTTSNALDPSKLQSSVALVAQQQAGPLNRVEQIKKFRNLRYLKAPHQGLVKVLPNPRHPPGGPYLTCLSDPETLGG